MDLAQVKQDIAAWIENFVEVPHPQLGGWPPCPYARSARLKNSYEVCIGIDPYFDLKNRSRWGMNDKEVIIYAYNPKDWNHRQFSVSIQSANEEYLIKNNLIALEDHPDDIEIVNGVCMNQGTYALALVQSLSDLNDKARTIAAKGFYHDWPEDYLQGLFKYRQDPRK